MTTPEDSTAPSIVVDPIPPIIPPPPIPIPDDDDDDDMAMSLLERASFHAFALASCSALISF